MSASFLYYNDGIPTQVDVTGPAFGDSIAWPHKVVLKLSMAGTIRTTKRTQEDSKLLLAFDNLTITEYNSLMTLISLADGRAMRYDGPQGKWCVKAPAIIERAARNRNFYSVTLELVGRKTDETRLLRLMDDTGYLLLHTGCYLLLEGA
jgi:hypothetical protein